MPNLRGLVAYLLRVAAAAAARSEREEWRLPLARDAITNAAPRGFACWADVEVPSVRRPKLEGEPYLRGAR
jgi:hypothetical protein